MLNNFHRCEQSMGSDNTTIFGYCPKPKKSKPSECTDRNLPAPNWAHLPSVVTTEIFNLLDETDRKNASSVCKTWRGNIFQPRFWQTVSFPIEPEDIEKANFFVSNFGKIVVNAKVKINTLIPECTDEFITLIETFCDNNNLKELIIEATHCRLELPYHVEDSNKRQKLKNVGYTCTDLVNLLNLCLPYMTKFSIGCIEELSHSIEDYLRALASQHPLKVTVLGFASVKDIPDEYELSGFDPDLITPFQNLRILSIDYDHLSDQFLNQLNNARDLERLVVHLHGIRENHSGTSDDAWVSFKDKHPTCELRLTAIHAYDEIDDLHSRVLRREMPLSHLKIFFCEKVNTTVLEYSLACYQKTLRCFVWVDSLNDNDISWTFVDTSPDPLVLMSWLCKKLEKIVLYGYKYREENLIAIARLRGENLKMLEIAEDDVLFCRHEYTREDCLIDIPLNIKKPWAPIKTNDLHPVIRNPTAGDSDEYLLPIVLEDLH